jgi:hypothetical protein
LGGEAVASQAYWIQTAEIVVIADRLLLMTALCVVVAAFWKQTPPGWCFVLIIIAVQFANVGAFPQ